MQTESIEKLQLLYFIQDVRKIAVNQNKILLLCRMVLMRHVSVHKEEDIIGLIEHQTKLSIILYHQK